MAGTRKRSFWGWGWDDKFPDATARKAVGEHAQQMVGFAPERCDEPPLLESIELRAPRLSAPAVLSALVTDDHESRIRHTYGRSYRDVLRGFRGDFAAAPDLVATPADEAEITAVLDWASDAKVAVIPFGGGTSVVGGVEGDVDDRYRAVLSLDLERLNRVVSIASVEHAMEDELMNALRSARAATFDSHARCGSEGHWSDQAGYFVARAAVAAVMPVAQSRAGGPAWQAAMSCRMARTSMLIEGDAGEPSGQTESDWQYQTLSDFLND